jgi:alkylated DNA repair dioxygenase AlkB
MGGWYVQLTGSMSELQILRGWNRDPGLLDAIRGLFAYDPPTDNRATGYIYSLADKVAWPDTWADRGPRILVDLKNSTGVRFTIMAFQAYRNGTGCDWHADTAFDAHAVLSLGVTRTFGIRPNGGEPEWFKLNHGDLAFMPSGFQDSWQHCVPEEYAPGERCSLVFRTVKHGL